MKLRIRGNSVRLRLTQTEVKKLTEEGIVEEKTEFGNGQVLVYAVSSSNQIKSVTASFENNRLDILLPNEAAQNWAENEEVGISESLGSLQILVEKDFKCLTPRAGDEDSDTFPHPNEKTHNC